VGSRLFVEITKERLGIKAKGRRVIAQNSFYELREPAAPHRGVFGVKNGLLRLALIFRTKYNRYQTDSVVPADAALKDTSYQIMIRICGFFLIGFGGWFLLSVREYLNRCFPGHIV